MSFSLHVRGDRACFRRIEFAEDLVSYDVITPMAARGIFEAVYTLPGLCWRIDEIRVLRPIRSTWMSLAEAEGGDPATARIAHGRRDRRMANVLVDVGYILTAGIVPPPGDTDDPVSRHEAMFYRAARYAGRAFRPPYLGLRGFLAEIEALAPGDRWPPADAPAGSIDLGWMLHDMPPGGSAGPRLFRPNMVDGVIDLRRRESLILAG